MNNYTWVYIQNHPKETKRLLGINYEQLQQLIDYLKFLEDNENKAQEAKKIRINKSGGGRDNKISKEEQIILTLIYLRHHLNFQLLALMFKISESTAHNIFHKWQKRMESALPCSLLEQVKKSEENLEEMEQILTHYELIVDSEEQEIERSLDYEQQKKHYSGKKKKHTFKNQIICLPRGEDIVDVVAGEQGRKADITIWRENANKFDEKQKFSGDKAYVGEPQIRTPKKKPKNGELTQEEKEQNKEISSERIFVEYLIRIIKVFKVMGERFRLKKEEYESVFLRVCGLVRLRMKTLIIKYQKKKEVGEVIDVLLTHIFSSKLSFS
ncbi:transposase family protein [Cyanobacterium aponinum UTEX 3221]|uniref:transposase family protein n=1 Tax=Cyanobacterium aponinum TaxID=379064 RepID=UPI002B4BB5A0|nr:transposase family protein [Cyanobacterium aponinum]WRL38184.1 transposase family protein [Cyanobacterium aponinum UTEX 3221]